MKQITQNYRSGELRVEEVPTPICRRGSLLVRTQWSLISAGTERMKVSQARMSLLQKARSRPDKVRQVLQNVRQVGLSETVAKVRERLDTLTPLGYSLAGVVEEVGEGVVGFAVGDVVACAGEGLACHAEFVCVPRNLCAVVPACVDPRDAAFTTVGAIALHGVRQSGAVLGESVVVIGLGLVGLLAVQILKAAGCRPIGVDVDPTKLEQARVCGADLALHRGAGSLEQTIISACDGFGADVVYVAASTRSADPIQLAQRIVRDRGRIVIVGMAPIQADWQECYRKEVSIILSRSYGPGRYDRSYEHKGVDYPVGYVRWTQNRNMGEFLRLLSISAVRPAAIGARSYPLDQAAEVYTQLLAKSAGQPAAALFEYSKHAKVVRRTDSVAAPKRIAKPDALSIGLIGAGNFATATLIPALKRLKNVRFRAVCSASGLSAKSASVRHGFEYCASDYREILEDESVFAVVVATRHDSHASIAADALRAGKHVFVEKPLALDEGQLDALQSAHSESSATIMPGFNRRFQPLAAEAKRFFEGFHGPLEMICRVNAGSLGTESWYVDPEEGGLRIISEGCHFVDLLSYLASSEVVDVHAAMAGEPDNCLATLRFASGSIASFAYVTHGGNGADKEYVEVFGGGRTARIANWKECSLASDGNLRKVLPHRAGKGHTEEIAAWVAALRNGTPPPIDFASALATTRTTFEIARRLRMDFGAGS